MAEVLSTQNQMNMEIVKNRDTSAPLPNPPFVFPMQSDFSSQTTPHMRTSYSAATGSRHSTARSRPQKLSLNALPAFDFSPATSSPINRNTSPTRSPSRMTPPAHHGHRRNNSEYVGGDISNGGPVLVSTSPTKSEDSGGHTREESVIPSGDVSVGEPTTTGLSPPESEGGQQPQKDVLLGPPTGRRGHAHRRSGAISSHDLSAILKPRHEAKGGSAPTTPSDPLFHRTLPPELDRSTSQPALTASTQDSSRQLVLPERPSTTDLPRSRVGFSDTLEYILPTRPLSTISSETSSSISTIRANHSVADSVTSFVNAGTCSSAQSTINARIGAKLTYEHDPLKARSSTTDNLSPRVSGNFEWDSQTERPLKRPSSAPAGNSSSKGTNVPSVASEGIGISASGQNTGDISTVSRDSFRKSARMASRPVSGSANLKAHRRRPTGLGSSPTPRPRTSPEPKVTKRQRKGRSWAALLSRKGKHQEHEEEFINRRSPPPLRNSTQEAEFSLDDISFDEDTTCIIETASPYASRSTRLETNIAAWKPRETSPLSETDSLSSMLDIDAAMSSFDMPSIGPAFEEVTVGGVAVTKRRMHSSGATGGFAGPGMHYHRRAESAPELVAVDRSKFGFPRLGSNTAMAIEEEEEEEEDVGDEVATNVPRKSWTHSDQDEAHHDQATGLGVSIVEADSANDQPMQRAPRRPSRRTSENDSPMARTPKEDVTEDFSPVVIVGAYEEPRFSVITKSSDETTITPTLSHDPIEARPASAPIDFAMPTPALTYGTPETPSAVSSPDFSRTSFDVPRMHTATSSITDRATVSSTRTGEHGLTLHSSVDDVPSLTSSASTMTSNHPPRTSISANTCSSTDCSGSISAAVPRRTRPVSAHKRSSLASLSRLVGSSYNKSKLNIEECVQPDAVERSEKKKGNRISRLMKFWRSKEKLSSS